MGKHKERLTSFELALRDAGIASQNLVRVSSFFRRGARSFHARKADLPKPRRSGIFCHRGELDARAAPAHRIQHRRGHSADRDTYGYLSEHHSFGETEEQAGSTQRAGRGDAGHYLDVDFDPDTSWDEKKEIYRISNKIVRTATSRSRRGRQARKVDHHDCSRRADSG